MEFGSRNAYKITVIPAIMLFTDNDRLSLNNLNYVSKHVPKTLKAVDKVCSSIAIECISIAIECISIKCESSSTTSIYDEGNNSGNVHCTTTNAYDEEYNCEDVDFIAPDSNKDEEKHFFWNEPEQKQKEDKENILIIKLKTEIPEYCEMASQFCMKTATQLIHTILPHEVLLTTKFDKRRKLLKLCLKRDKLLEDDYMDVVAQVEVKIINKESNLKAELADTEQQQWENDEGLSLIPTSEIEKNRYDEIILHLKNIRIL